MKFNLLKYLIVGSMALISAICSSQITISPKAGVHQDLKSVQFNLGDGKAFYTTDGTRPNFSHKQLKPSINIKGNTVFRIAYYNKEGKRKDTTASFITELKHKLPVISIVTNPANFFDYTYGIYVKGCCAEETDPYKGANFWKNWEREINLEFFETDGSIALNQKAGVKIFGGYSKGRPQKSLAIYARSKYGNKKFKHQIFPQLDFKKYKNFVLRNAGSDMQEAHVRDVYATQLVKNTGLDIQEYRPSAVYINGEYWGIYNIREKINEHYIKNHYGYNTDSLSILRHNGGHQHGSTKRYKKFIKYLKKNDLKNADALNYVSKEMDIDNYILYNICETYTANGDAGGNIRYYASEGPKTPWKWVFYDLDIAMNIGSNSQMKENTIKYFTTKSTEAWPNPAWSTFIIRKILENDSLQGLYINQFCDLLNTNFHKDTASHLINRLLNDVKPEIDNHLDRWKISRKAYDKSVNDLKLFAQNRPTYLLKYLKEKFNKEKELKLKIVLDNKEGRVVLNTLNISNNFEGVYLQDVPLRIEAIPNFEYDFVGWKEVKNVSSKRYESFNDTLVSVTPIFKKRARSKNYGEIVFSEIDTKQKENKCDFIELYNTSDKDINLANYRIKDEELHDFVFGNVVLKAKSFLVLTNNVAAFKTKYGKIDKLIEFDFGLNHKKDELTLYDAADKIVYKCNLTQYSAEQEELNYALFNLNNKEDAKQTYIFEKPTPGKESSAFNKLLEKKKEDAFLLNILYGIILFTGLLTLILVLLLIFRSKK